MAGRRRSITPISTGRARRGARGSGRPTGLPALDRLTTEGASGSNPDGAPVGLRGRSVPFLPIADRRSRVDAVTPERGLEEIPGGRVRRPVFRDSPSEVALRRRRARPAPPP